MAGYAARCEKHGLSAPCLSCAADHVAGDDHVPGEHYSTCRRCRTRTTPPEADNTRPPPRRTRRRPDFAALAAHDTDLT